MFSKARIEALSDGLFAIVLTLLILDIKAPVGVAHGELANELMKEGPAWVTFALTFFLGSILWVDQHKVLQMLSEVSKRSLILNLVFLALVSVMPFSTSLLGHYLRVPFVLRIYFLNQMACAVALTAQLEMAIRAGETREGVDLFSVRFRLIAMSLIMGSAVLAASFLDIHYYALAPISAGIVARVIKREWKKRRALQVAA